jgi:hypothetical protein
LRGQSVPTIYRFTDETSWARLKLQLPQIAATNDWRAFTTIDEARAAISNAVHLRPKRAKEKIPCSEKRSGTMRKTNTAQFEIQSREPISTLKIEAEAHA